jgi:hypothetical protein
MIRYGDYNGAQGDVVVRDGHVVPCDPAAAHEMAQQAHELSSGVFALDGGTEGGTAQRNRLSKPIASRVNEPATSTRISNAVQARYNNVSAMKPQAPTAPRKTTEKPDMKSGLPGTPEEQRRDLRVAMKKHEETLRRLAQ